MPFKNLIQHLLIQTKLYFNYSNINVPLIMLTDDLNYHDYIKLVKTLEIQVPNLENSQKYWVISFKQKRNGDNNLIV